MIFFMAFGINIIVISVFALLGPVAHTERNSKYYSAIAPPSYSGPEALPMVTIQVPVYKVRPFQR